VLKKLWLKLDQRIIQEIRSQRKLIYVGLLCTLLATALEAGMALPIKMLLSAVSDGEVNRLYQIAVIIFLAFCLKYFFTRGQLYYLQKAAMRLTADLRMRLFAKLQHLPISYFNEKRGGGIQSVLSNDVSIFQTAITGIRDALAGPLKVILGIAAIFFFQWKLALVAIAVIPFMAYFIQNNAKRMKVAQRAVQDNLGELTATMHEQILGTRIVRAFGAEDRTTSLFARMVEKVFNSQVVAIKRIAALRPMVELIGASALALTVVAMALLIKQDPESLNVGDLGAFLYALDVINKGAKSVGVLGQTMAQVQAAVDRIYSEILDIEEDTGDLAGAHALESLDGRIEFKDVSFIYPDGTPALKNVSFSIEPGTSLALVGPSGSGKSTIADLLLRFYDPTEGQVLLDGVDIRELKGQWLRQQIGVVPQQTFLFAGSVADNLRLGAPDADDAQVEAAARAANAHDFIMNSNGGYDAELGEQGVRMSGGEGQRLAIARALVKDPKMLLLDEATSNLDAHSEKVVTKALEQAMHARSTLFIAHRLTTAARATKIIMLNQGEILEQGTHDELVAANGAYAGMYRAFSSGVLEDDIG
jgi:subfamily B ATP-binding cassette protein MsbA